MKVLSGLVFVSIIFLHCQSTNGGVESPTSFVHPTSFDGKMMSSDDFGKSWKSIDAALPKTFDIITLHGDDKSLMVGGDKAEIFDIDVANISQTKRENTMQAVLNQNPIDQNRVTGIFTGPSGKYAYVLGVGILRKKNNSSLWQPITTPQGFYHVDQIVENSAGQIFLANHYGLYLSDDQGNSWKRIFKQGFVKSFILNDDLILINSVSGIYQSIDNGNTWTNSTDIITKLGASGSSMGPTSIFEENGIMYIFKKQESTLLNVTANCCLLYSKDSGKTWSNHPIESFLNSQKQLQSIFIHDNKMFCISRTKLHSTDDNGATWNTILTMPPSEPNSTFQLLMAGGKLICVKMMAGC